MYADCCYQQPAGIYTLVETAKANGLNAMKYIKYILSDMPGRTFLENPEYLDDYLPWEPLVQERCRWPLSFLYRGFVVIFLFTILFDAYSKKASEESLLFLNSSHDNTKRVKNFYIIICTFRVIEMKNSNYNISTHFIYNS